MDFSPSYLIHHAPDTLIRTNAVNDRILYALLEMSCRLEGDPELCLLLKSAPISRLIHLMKMMQWTTWKPLCDNIKFWVLERPSDGIHFFKAFEWFLLDIRLQVPHGLSSVLLCVDAVCSSSAHAKDVVKRSPLCEKLLMYGWPRYPSALDAREILFFHLVEDHVLYRVLSFFLPIHMMSVLLCICSNLQLQESL